VKNFMKKCLVKPGTKIDLSQIDPAETFGWKKSDAKDQTEQNLKRIAELQDVLYAEGKHSIALVLQAMDTGGKDGTVKTVGGAMNPAGVNVVSVKKPTPAELADCKADPVKGFLKRIEKHVPQKGGQVLILNRSHYEDVGIVRVHDLAPGTDWNERFGVIRDFEKRISKPSDAVPGGVHVLKFFLHISPEEQLERLEARLDDPTKHWKVSEDDFKERPFWNAYMKAYSEAISNTSTEDAPWIVIPADNKWMRDLIISQIVVDCLEGLKMKYPEPEIDAETLRERYFDKRGDLKAEFDINANKGLELPGPPPGNHHRPGAHPG
jgi:PPK2 family polyphosphate:nucleotide phosphotransferase